MLEREFLVVVLREREREKERVIKSSSSSSSQRGKSQIARSHLPKKALSRSSRSCPSTVRSPFWSTRKRNNGNKEQRTTRENRSKSRRKLPEKLIYLPVIHLPFRVDFLPPGRQTGRRHRAHDHSFIRIRVIINALVCCFIVLINLERECVTIRSEVRSQPQKRNIYARKNERKRERKRA